jgi:hypothetical protein
MNARPKRGDWPEAHTVILRRAWALGRTAVEIRDHELASFGYTKSAIIGKARRLQLPRRHDGLPLTKPPRGHARFGPAISPEREDRDIIKANRKLSQGLLARLLMFHGKNPPDADSRAAVARYAGLCPYPREKRI